MYFCYFPLKVVIHLTDGIDAPYDEMKRRVEELRLSGKKMMKHKVHSGIIYPEIAKVISELKYVVFWKTGVNSFILVGLEGASKLEEASVLEFGRGFRYTTPLRLNIMDLDYELLEELVGTDD